MRFSPTAQKAQAAQTTDATAELLRLKAEMLVTDGSKLTRQELLEGEQLPSTSTQTTTPTVDSPEIQKLIAEAEASMLADLRAINDALLAIEQTLQNNISG
jgi:hypothetical protein